MNKYDLTNVPEQCRNCPNVVYPHRFIKNNKVIIPTCKLSLRRPGFDSDDVDFRGFYGDVNPNKCNNGTEYYRY